MIEVCDIHKSFGPQRVLRGASLKIETGEAVVIIGRSGGGKSILPLEFERAETWYSLEPSDRLSADKLFDRSWVMTVIARAMEMLKIGRAHV